jgi:hypothetical protein
MIIKNEIMSIKKPKKIRRKIKPISHDALFKKIMQEEVAAREFLEYYSLILRTGRKAGQNCSYR